MNAAERREANAQLERDWYTQQHEAPNPALVAPALAQDAAIRSHLAAENAILQGEWPFVCPYCSDPFQTDAGQFPYCSPRCAINATTDR